MVQGLDTCLASQSDELSFTVATSVQLCTEISELEGSL